MRLRSLLLFAILIPRVSAATVTIHTDDARATLLAIENPTLTHEEALRVAEMHGNHAVVRKLNEFNIACTTNSFANALYAAAHNQRVTSREEMVIALDTVKPKTSQLLALLKEIDSNPGKFQQAIEDRIAIFTPANADIHLDGYVVASGDGGGYAFGDTDFFLNIAVADDFVMAKNTTTHELYHAVQGAFAKDREWKPETIQDEAHKACAHIEQLFANLYEEGTARYVEDPSLLSLSHSDGAIRILEDFNDGVKHANDSSTLLEMSVDTLNAAPAPSLEDVYAVGFYGHGVLYGIAFAMADAIAAQDGPQGIMTALKEPPYKFVLHYTRTGDYGADRRHPRLGANTIAAAQRLADGCPYRSSQDFHKSSQ